MRDVDATVYTTLPVTDLERARAFYAGTLGLKDLGSPVPGRCFFGCPDGTRVMAFVREEPPKANHTACAFLVSDLLAEMERLRAAGAEFEDYPTGPFQTEDGVWRHESGAKAAWFKDPDGNLLGLVEVPGVR